MVDRGFGTGGVPESSSAGFDGFTGVERSGVAEAAAAAASAVGTDTAAPQYGHFTFFPADSSRARNRFMQDGQPSVIGMTYP